MAAALKSIEVSCRKHPDYDYGWVKLTTTAKHTVSFTKAVMASYSFESMDAARKKATSLTMGMLNMTNSVGSRYIYFDFSQSNGAKSFVMTIGVQDDVKNLIEFNTTTGGLNYFGLQVDVRDLHHLSGVEVLGLRYGLFNLKPHALIDLRGFTRLKELWLGPGENVDIDQIILTDDTMGRLTVCNAGMRKLPANFVKLKKASAIYTEDVRSWAQVENDLTAMFSVKNLTVIGASPEYFAAALDYFHKNRAMIVHGIYMPDFTRNPCFLDSDHVGKIIDILDTARNVSTFLIGNHAVTKVSSTQISIEGRGIYPINN